MSILTGIFSELQGSLGIVTLGSGFFLSISVVVATCIVLRNSYLHERSSYNTKNKRALAGRNVFKSDKNLGIKEQIMMTMLEDNNADNTPKVSFVVTDPDLMDNPIIYASEGFSEFTGYSKKEIEGRNCRFLQGPQTDKADVSKIRESIDAEREASLELLNYKKDGTSFRNQFFLCPLLCLDGKVGYFLGVQKEIDDDTSFPREGENSGFRLFKWL